MFEPLPTNSPEYQRMHRLVRKVKGDPISHKCSCGWLADHWSWVHGLDPKNPDNYVALCHDCHHEYDGVRPPVHAKLTEKEVLEIRAMAKDIRQIDLAYIYGISPQTISAIINRRTWNHV